MEPEWTLSQHTANLPFNEEKNRYCNVFPCKYIIQTIAPVKSVGADGGGGGGGQEGGEKGDRGPAPPPFLRASYPGLPL